MNADVVVIGAGIVGAACARALARAGLSIVIVDRGAPASATSARGEGNLLVSDKAPGPELDLALLAAAHWPQLAEELADELNPAKAIASGTAYSSGAPSGSATAGEAASSTSALADPSGTRATAGGAASSTSALADPSGTRPGSPNSAEPASPSPVRSGDAADGGAGSAPPGPVSGSAGSGDPERRPAASSGAATGLGSARTAFPDIEYDRKGGIVVATTEEGAEPLRAFARGQAAVGVEVEHLSAAEALSLEPHLHPGITAAVHYPQDAQLQPVVATEALLASARLAGVRVVANSEVLGVERVGERITGVRTSTGVIGTNTVVVAAGPWSGAVAGVLGADLPVRPRRGIVLVTARMPQRVFHKVYDGDYFGATQSADADLQTSSVVESTPGGTVLIGSSRQQIGFDDRLRVEVLAQVAQRALRLFPFLEGTPVIRAYGGFRPYVPDHLPVIGEDHRHPGLWYATGHEGAGIGLAGVTGDLLCAQLTGTEPALDPAPFLPSRPSLAAHLTTRVAGAEAGQPPAARADALNGGTA
ncbi:hypothetical protein GCM10009830_29110 [Glycomyces endophyticus]|uniref:FAD dependent oxidoreductase domain-containing protein n=1 Tax=Glycomyces endophyticus TaxID=480996 RepID=A0ABN2H1E5_9ACTN